MGAWGEQTEGAGLHSRVPCQPAVPDEASDPIPNHALQLGKLKDRGTSPDIPQHEVRLFVWDAEKPQ